MYPFQNSSSTSGILIKSIVSAKFTCDLCGESEREREIRDLSDLSPT